MSKYMNMVDFIWWWNGDNKMKKYKHEAMSSMHMDDMDGHVGLVYME
jgi:hypothetical protein